MELPEQLLVLSRGIAGTGEVGEASLRRAVSTAYYAAFRLLTTNAAKLTTNAAKRLAPGQPEGLRSRLCRMFDHCRCPAGRRRARSAAKFEVLSREAEEPRAGSAAWLLLFYALWHRRLSWV